jgi:hypothetical protein
VDEAAGMPGIRGVEVTVAAGRPIEQLPEGDRYLGFIFARGETPEGVEASLRRAQSLLDIEVTPG